MAKRRIEIWSTISGEIVRLIFPELAEEIGFRMIKINFRAVAFGGGQKAD
ncbi:hypothetical protein HZY88_05940 [Aerococcaceae bacterium DSM 111176]|nr:hypothetical protein [Aerococcaceae bacterium DSM 111176]